MANYAIMRIEKCKLGPVGRIGLKRILIKREVPTHFLSRPLLRKLSKTQKSKSRVFPYPNYDCCNFSELVKKALVKAELKEQQDAPTAPTELQRAAEQQ